MDFIEQLKRDPFNTGIDIDRELLRAQKWCRQKGRRCTQRFFEKWVGRADRLVPESKPKTIPSKVILQGTQWEDKPLDESKRAEVSQKMKELQQQMRMPT